MENSHRGAGRKQRGQPLAKQLQLKEMQLGLMKKHMTRLEKHKSNEEMSPRRGDLEANAPNYNSMQQILPHRPGSSLQPKLVKKFQTKRDSSRPRAEVKTPMIQQQIAMFSVDSESRGSQLQQTLHDHSAGMAKYAEINGRDASPPVRDQRRRSAEKVAKRLQAKYQSMQT